MYVETSDAYCGACGERALSCSPLAGMVIRLIPAFRVNKMANALAKGITNIGATPYAFIRKYAGLGSIAP